MQRNTPSLTEKNGILMHLALWTIPLHCLCGQPDVATGREHGSGFVLPGQAAQDKTSRGDARQDKPSRCVGQARRERCPLVLKNTVARIIRWMDHPESGLQQLAKLLDSFTLVYYFMKFPRKCRKHNEISNLNLLYIFFYTDGYMLYSNMAKHFEPEFYNDICHSKPLF